MQRVTSAHNDRVRDVARLIASSRDRRKSNRCVLEGAHLIDVYLARVGPPETLLVVDDALDDPAIEAIVARVPAARTISITRALFAQIATLPADIKALAVVAAPRSRPSSIGECCLLLDDVQDPGNVGTMIRTAAAAGCDQVVLSKRCAFAWSPRALRAGQGAHFLTALVEDVDADEWASAFRAAGGRVIATVVDGAPSLYGADLRGRVAVAIGSEGRGLSASLLAAADQRVTIPMAADSESLNAAAAAAVVLFERVRQQRSAAESGAGRR
jgi:TrmH family RNA methyltransferase